MFRRFSLAVLFVLALAVPAFAVTAADVLDRMTDKERAGYLTGAVEMAMVVKPEKAECVLNWYYGKDAPGPAQVVAALGKYRDKPAASVINALIARACQ